ncbi:cGMP-gated cation channel alpha-1 [Phytophthora citrophthora]|uniref:cGMP-gated cation channel alpha-1 n=1 Tax=Phytophthora citrophthora TaxID=4793 RepID=A0AAD9LPN8_9STRA|nr:cGMP-gated cation channel alpha-1 [Phytophthora citrophthora]
MPHRKVYAAADDGALHELEAATEDPIPRRSVVNFKSSANIRSRPSSKNFLRVWRRLYRRVSKPVKDAYKKLPWTTRQTISVTISLYAALYLFLTIPFRIAFYYNPFQHSEQEQVHRWTEELNVFTPLDLTVDVIGFVEFVSFYHVWKDSFSQLSAAVSFELGKKLTRDANRLKMPKLLIHTHSSNGLRTGKAKWTLASIKPLSTVPGADDTTSQRRYLLVRNLEFALELIALVPMDAFVFATGAFNTLHLSRITKLGRVYRIRHCFEKIANIYSDRSWVQHLSSTGINSLVRNIGLCVGLCHYVACGYMLLAHAQCGVDLEACEEDVETSWAVRDRLFGASVARKYARSLYWASRTIILLGYSDVTPVSDAETMYAIAAILLGALYGSSVLATYLFIFRIRNARYAAFASHVDNAREYMRSQNIARVVRRQVIAYFSYSWSTHHSLDSEEALHIMPKHLQSKVVATLKASRVKQVCFLMRESVEFINLLALALARRVYSPADQITEPKFNAQMFFVIRGKVMLSAFDGSNPKECQTGDFFADSCLLSPEKYEENAVAKTFCELYVLAKAKFDEAVTHLHRGNEDAVRDRMTETLEKYSTQLRKTKKLLGLRGGHESGGGNGSAHNVAQNAYSGDRKRGISWRLPGSYFRVYWETARLLAIVYVAFEVPFFSVFIAMSDDQDMFAEQPEFGFRYTLTLLVELFFAVDLVLRARYFAFLDQSVMLEVTQPDLIFAAYQASGFYLDLLAWLPVGIVFDSVSINARLSLLRLLRLLRVRDMPTLLRNISEYHGISSKTQLVASLLLGVTLMLHVVGCVWFEMAWIAHDASFNSDSSAVLSELSREDCLKHATQFQNCSWVKYDCYSHIGAVFPLQDLSSTYKASFAYLRSLYWAIVTLTAVGYGDIAAYSTAESYFAALWIFVGGIINFGVVGAMSSTISNAMATQHHHIEKLNTLNSILERMDISEKLSSEIRRFYHHQFVEHKHAYESQLLSNLPDQLCYQISSLLHSEAVKAIPLFDSASTEFLHEITGKFRHRSYQHGETICLEGDICREFFVFLHGSKINVFFHIRKVPIRALHEGECYGVSEFLLRKACSATLIAASIVQASVMTREQFDVIQRKFAGDISDIKEEAQELWMDQQIIMRRVVHNLERLKLQPHMIQTPTLFTQRDNAVATLGKTDKRKRDVDAVRDRFTSIWNAIITCWNIYNSFFTIFRICFHAHLHFSKEVSTAVWLADLGCDFCFAFDIYLRLFYFGCPEAGFENLVTREEKDKQYLRSSTFKWDLLASLPLYIPISSGSVAAGLCRIPRLIRCVDLFVYLDDVIVQIQQYFASYNVSAYLSPLKLMIILVLLAHCVGCIFFLISDNECEHVELCWLDHDHLVHEYHHSVPILYGKSFYWAITTLLLVGSNESVPRDTAGTLWTSLTCLFCTFIIGHIVGEISELILELGKEAKQYKSRIANFDSFAKENALPENLRERVGFFFHLQFEHTDGLDLHSTVHDLSANLRLKLMLEIYGHSIALLPIRSFLTASQINNLALRMQSELFIPGDNIVVEGTFGSRLCIMRKGFAAAFWHNSVTSVAVLMEGALFGEIAFFLVNQRRLATVQATTSCEVLYVTKQDWQELWTTDGDLSDIQVQKHALHAILEWVGGRLSRYQRINVRVARKAKRLLSSRQAKAANGNGRLPGLSGVRPLKKEGNRLSLPSEIELLEKKTKYLLAKTDTIAAEFHDALAALHSRQRASSGASNRSTRPSVSRKRSTGKTNEMHRSTIGDVVAPIAKRSSKSDIHMLQFMMDLNPVNKQVRDNFTDAHLHQLETESWARFKIFAAVQHNVKELLENLFPSEETFTHHGPDSGGQNSVTIKIHPSRGIGKRQSSYSFNCNGNANRKTSLAESSAGRRAIALQNAAKVTMIIGSAEQEAPSHRRRFSTVAIPEALAKNALQLSTATSNMPLKRSRSLPLFEEKYFQSLSLEGTAVLKLVDGQTWQGNIDFAVIQRCQRPKYATQLRLYHQYREWKIAKQSPVVQSKVSSVSVKRLSDVRPFSSSLRGKLQLLDPARRTSNGGQRGSVAKFQLASERTETVDPQSRAFIRRIKELGKAWDILMLCLAVYHVWITPFKLCFATDLAELPHSVLRTWSGFEVFMDVILVLDVSYRVRYASLPVHSIGVSLASSQQGGLRRIFASNPDLRSDILAMLPLELLLFVSAVRAPLAYAPSAAEAAHTAWWTSRWLLRMNRVLLLRRIEPLSEEFFQYLVYDRKLPVDDATLDFLRGITTYLTMAHILACIWYITSEHAFHQYGTSWLSTSGMLVYIADGATVAHETGRMLSEQATAFCLDCISLSRKYMRSVLFSIECISTLFYGDILSMNPLELVAEIIITLWSINIFGALVGAQGELLNAEARREAAFEQNLGEIQHYLVQNGVPKKLKRQIKSYYARVWRRRKGGEEFAAVTNVSRHLYEDVVLATLRGFATRIAAFRALDEHFLRGLLVCLQYVVCSEGEEVTMKGDVDRSMYFIATGRVLVKLDTGESVCERGEFFGEMALLYGITRLETCVALTLTKLYRLDHEPYERLLQDFPEYRQRNKLEWTSSNAPAPDRIMLEAVVRDFRSGHKLQSKIEIPSVFNSDDVVANAERINADVPYSHIYKFMMDLLAHLHRVDPLEARDLVLQGRASAQKQLKALLGLATSREELSRTDPPSPQGVALVSPFRTRGCEEPANQANTLNSEPGQSKMSSMHHPPLLMHSISYGNLTDG